MRGNPEEKTEKEINFRNEENITHINNYQIYRSGFYTIKKDNKKIEKNFSKLYSKK